MWVVVWWACPVLAAILAAVGVGGRRRVLLACAAAVALPFVVMALGALAFPGRAAGSEDLTWPGAFFLSGCFSVAAALAGLLIGGVGHAVVRRP